MGPKLYHEQYFHTLNPLAKRIVEDIIHTRESYESLWGTLTVPEQRQILDEAIIRPEAVLKYSRQREEVQVFPCFRVETGAKYVVYEDGTTGKGISWRDEHSAPFSWLTRSQQDLRTFYAEEPAPATHHKTSKSATPVRKARPKAPAPPAPPLRLEMDPPSLVLGGTSAQPCSKQTILDKLISKTAVLKIPFSGKGSSQGEMKDHPETESLLTKDGARKATILKPKTPPPPPPKKSTLSTPRGSPPKPPPKMSTLTPREASPPPRATPPPLPLAEIQKAASAIKARHAEREEQVVEDGKEEGSPLLPAESSASGASAIPKTGFEFLDNW